MPLPRFTSLLLLLLLWIGAALPGEAGAQEPTVRLRLLAANLTSGNSQDYVPGHGIRIMDGLNPDVVMIQEFSYGNNTPASIRQMVDMAFGPDFFYFRETGATLPNGIISRFPILAAGQWNDPETATRDFAWARIDIPGNIDLWAVSVHLLTDDIRRNPQALDLVDYVRAMVPAGDYLSIGGDFNSDSRTEAALNTLSQVVRTAGPYPVDQSNDPDTNANRTSPYDAVYVNAGLQGRATGVVLGGMTFANGLVFDTRKFSPLSAAAPALMADSDAPNMQHMAVVRDFLLPVPEPGSAVLLLFVGVSWAGRRWRRAG